MQKIKVITDSASDIVNHQNPSLTVLPMTIRFGNEEYFDGVNITHNEFYEKLIESDELPVTSLVSPASFEEKYEEAFKTYEKIIVITISSKFSGTYQSALIAANDNKNIFVIDSLNVAIGEQILVDLAFRLIEKGLSAEEIADELNKEKLKIHTLALLDTLEYLKKGGRISKSVALVGGVLSVKPVVTVNNGAVEMLGTARGSKNGNNFLIKEVEKAGGIDFEKPLCLGYTGLNDVLLKKYIEDSKKLWSGHDESLKISPIGSTVGTHIGPNAIAISFFAK